MRHERSEGVVRDGTQDTNIGTIATRALPVNANRTAWYLVNQTVNDGRVGYNQNVTPTRGYLLGRDGGGVRSNRFGPQSDGDTTTQEVFAALGAAAGNVTVYAWEVYEPG